METGQRQTTFDARDYVRVIQQRKWFILIVALTAMVIGAIYAVSYPKRFRASAWVIVYSEPEPFFWMAGDKRDRTRRISLETQAAMAESNDVAVMAATSLGARTSAKRIIVSPKEIVDSIAARAFPPDRIHIQAVHRMSQHAIEFANQTAESFVEVSADYRRAEDRAAVEFLESQLEKAEQDLNDVLEAKQQKQKQWGIVSVQAGQEATASVGRYEGELAAAEAELAAISAQNDSLEQELANLQNASTMQHPVANPYRASLEAQLQTARLALTQLRARYRDAHPAIPQTQLQIEQLRDQIEKESVLVAQTQLVAQERATSLGNELLNTRLQTASISARIDVLNNLIRITRAKATDLQEKEELLSRDTYEAMLAQATYEGLLQELRARKLKEAAQQGTAAVLDRALQASAIEVNPVRSALFTAMLGLVAGIAFALLMEVLDTTVHTPDDILHHTEVDFLGIIPLGETNNTHLVTLIAPRSPPAEAFRTLRSNVNFATLDNPARTYLTTSAGGGEGKSLVTANLGVVFAQAGQSVIIVDSDLRRPIHHRLFGLRSAPGLTSVLMGEVALPDALQQTDVENLRVLTSGPLPPNPAELMDSERMTTLISDAANHADLVLFDSPPAIMLADAVILSSKVDQTILVAESGQVTRDAFNEMVRLITRARGHILGAVLNKLDVSRTGYYYYYYYYYYDDYAARAHPEDEGEAVENGTGPRRMPTESPIRPLNDEQSARFNGDNNQDDTAQ